MKNVFDRREGTLQGHFSDVLKQIEFLRHLFSYLQYNYLLNDFLQ